MSSNVNPFEVNFFRACDTLKNGPGMIHFIMQLHLLWQFLGYRHTKQFGGIVVLSYS